MPHWSVSLPDGTQEDYLVTLPRPHIELTNTSYTQSSSGWLSAIKYQGTPPIGSGSSFQASSFEGQWNTTSKDMSTDAVFADVADPKEEVTVRPMGRVVLCGSRLRKVFERAILKGRIDVCISYDTHILSVANERYDQFLIRAR